MGKNSNQNLSFRLLIGGFLIKNWNNYRIGIVASKKDEAALTQASLLEEMNYKIHYIDKSILKLSSVNDLPIEFDSWIVLSKHSSVAKKPSFTTHSVGNFGITNEQLGGENCTLGVSNAQIQSLLLANLFIYQQNNMKIVSEFNVVCEATHHGPTIDIPLTFIEMGSSVDVWVDKKIAQAVAWSVDKLLKENNNISYEIDTAIGFGGSHYPYKFANLMIERKFFIGHIFPKYAADNLNSGIIRQMISKTVPTPTFALIDKKGIKRKGALKTLLEDFDIEITII
ncbi:MAG: D-aminoacyl-tRNA deacylase [Candidatus Hodarchaeales archaeon]